jgi:copper chaperone NosL
MVIIRNLFYILVLFLLTGCEVQPVPIEFGKEECSFCKMTIVDRQHAAQLVTKKGKQFKYDAIECMLNDLNEKQNTQENKIYLVSDYGKSKMTTAEDATYLISQAIKSPMGAFLSAFSSNAEATSVMTKSGGEVYNWQEIKKKYGIE